MADNDGVERWRMRINLEGKIVMVTGASSGIGREFCLNLANSGCRIIAAARRADRLKTLCNQINAAGDVRSVAVEFDATSNGQTIDAVVQKAWDAFGHIDALINNAGIRGSVKSSLDVTEEEWNNIFRTNLMGAWLISKSACKRMRDAKIEGSIVNISSAAGLNRGHLPGSVAYAASKAALNIMTKVMAVELGVSKIRINSISPGIFRSEITEKLLEKDWIKNVSVKTIPLRTFGVTDPALTSLVHYLIDDSSNYVTGNIFIVDGGATLPGLRFDGPGGLNMDGSRVLKFSVSMSEVHIAGSGMLKSRS